MVNIKEKLKLALSALGPVPPDCCGCGTEWQIAINAINAALAQPAQEPVAWMHIMDNTEGIKGNGEGIVSITQKRKHPFGKPGVDFSKSYPVTSTPLYTTPPQRPWVELTNNDWNSTAYDTEFRAGAEWAEAKLKEKNS